MYSKKEIEKVFDNILEDIEQGKSLRQVLRNENKPSSRTFFKWLDNDENKVKRYARACSLRADSMFDDMIDISDTTEEGTTITESDKGIFTNTGDMIQHRRLKIDTRKWILSKMNPKKYGDSKQIKLTDGEGDKIPINAIFNIDLLNVPTDNSIKEDIKTQ